MKKKLLVGVFTGSLILGAATLSFAQTNDEGKRLFNFEQMKPHIEKMHPELNEEQLLELFNACHGDGGIMEKSDSENARNRMNKF